VSLLSSNAALIVCGTAPASFKVTLPKKRVSYFASNVDALKSCPPTNTKSFALY